jgi:hypothetical protein
MLLLNSAVRKKALYCPPQVEHINALDLGNLNVKTK